MAIRSHTQVSNKIYSCIEGLLDKDEKELSYDDKGDIGEAVVEMGVFMANEEPEFNVQIKQRDNRQYPQPDFIIEVTYKGLVFSYGIESHNFKFYPVSKEDAHRNGTTKFEGMAGLDVKAIFGNVWYTMPAERDLENEGIELWSHDFGQVTETDLFIIAAREFKERLVKRTEELYRQRIDMAWQVYKPNTNINETELGYGLWDIRLLSYHHGINTRSSFFPCFNVKVVDNWWAEVGDG